MGSGSSGSLAVGATMMFFGLFLGIAWVWLRFFRRSKSPRGGLSGGGGQVCFKIVAFSIRSRFFAFVYRHASLPTLFDPFLYFLNALLLRCWAVWIHPLTCWWVPLRSTDQYSQSCRVKWNSNHRKHEKRLWHCRCLIRRRKRTHLCKSRHLHRQHQVAPTLSPVKYQDECFTWFLVTNFKYIRNFYFFF